jgi:uncharacterized protein
VAVTDSWKLVKTALQPKLKSPLLIAGLPGIGNVGKVAVDFIIDELKAVKFGEFSSHAMPHSVFVNEASLIEMPAISAYYKRLKGQDLLFIAGDFQPIDERSCHAFAGSVLDLLHSYKGAEVMTLGGIGLPSVPKLPKVYATGTSKKIVEKYRKGTAAEPKLYGVVGPIIGVSGLLLGLAKQRNMNGVSLLAETYGHPMYLGIRGARELVKVINERLSFGIKIEELDREIAELESEAARQQKSASLSKAMRGLGKKPGDVSYIG